MAVVGLNLTSTRRYISDLDPAKGQENEKTEATVWILGALDSRVQGYLRDRSTKFSVNQGNISGENQSVETSISQAEMDFERVSLGLRGWENFKDSEGNDLKFETKAKSIPGSPKTYQTVSPDLIAMIPPDVISELASEIRRGNEVDLTEKNG